MAHPIPTTKTAVKAILAARPAWAAVDIRDGQWTESEDVTRAAFWFDDTEIARDGWAMLGTSRPRRVDFRLRFTIAILLEGDDERAAENQTWTLVEDLLAAIKTDPTFTGSIQQADDVTGTQVNAPYAPGLWQSTFRGAISCQSKSY